MESSDILKEIKRIAKEVLPKGGQLILYGSRARNEAAKDSDWDLLILLRLRQCGVSFCCIELGCRRIDKSYTLLEK